MLKLEKTMEELKSFYDNWHCKPDYYGLLSVETKANELLVEIKNCKLKVLERCLKGIKETLKENALDNREQIDLIIEFINENI